MKRFMSLLMLFCFLIAALAGCSENDAQKIDGAVITAGTGSVSTQTDSADSTTGTDNTATQPDSGTGAAGIGIETSSPVSELSTVDIDLTVLSSTMVMAEVNNIMENARSFIGKTIKISGPYFASYYELTDMFYHYVVIDACCMGLEFILSGDRTYPDDYPEDGTDIEVTGVFASYEELGKTYYYLATDEIVIQ